MTKPREELANRIAEWMLSVMEQKELSGLAWAERAGVSDTSITRVVKHRSHIPNARTLQKLADAAGVRPPPLEDGIPVAALQVPLLTAAQVAAMPERKPIIDNWQQSVGTDQHQAEWAVRIELDSTDPRDPVAGDLVIGCSLERRRPLKGSLVVGYEGGRVGCWRWPVPASVRAIGTALEIRRKVL